MLDAYILSSRKKGDTMSKRHSDALFIQEGACNPSGIALAIVSACKEMRDEPDHKGTDEITSDPAIRLMVHQLAFICSVGSLDYGVNEYSDAMKACRKVDN